MREEFNGDWARYIEAVHQVFRDDFVRCKPVYRNRRVGFKRLPKVDGKECTFYHLTHEGADEENRTPDLRRCERIRWTKPVIEKCDAWGLKVWAQERQGNTRICIWLEPEEGPHYVIVLADRGKYILLWTAFTMDQDHQIRKKQKEYDAYKKAEAAQQS